MHDSNSPMSHDLGLHAGDWVRVKTREEILATLDGEGCRDALPFMPEMLQHCGKEFRVFKSAHKACDVIHKTGNRAMPGAVHLDELRCDGKAHAGCQAACLLYWKSEWLQPVQGPGADAARDSSESNHQPGSGSAGCSLEQLERATRVSADGTPGEEALYRCQATELFRATTPMKWWDPRHYFRDVTSRNIPPWTLVRYILLAAFNAVMRVHWRLHQIPEVRGLAQGKTPSAVLNLQPGDLVEVRSKAEIMPTLNLHQKNRGLWYDVEMLPFSGKTYRVLKRVERIVDEKNGKLLQIPNDCIILDGVTCGGCLSSRRLFCPRHIYPYWREIWLKRAGDTEAKPGVAAPIARVD